MGRHCVLCVAEVQDRHSDGVSYRLGMVWQILIYLVGGGKQVGEKESIKAEHRRLFCLSSAWRSNPPLAVVSAGAKIRAQILPIDPSASMRIGRQSVEVGHLSLSAGVMKALIRQSL